MGKRKQWNPKAMAYAMNAVKEKKMSCKAAAKMFEVPRTTLKDYVKSSLFPDELMKKSIGRPPIFTHKIEDILVEYCLTMETHFYGLTAGDLSRTAYQLAMKNNLPHPFSIEREKAGRKWIRLFLKRHPNLCMRRPENLSTARVRGFTRENVNTFFSILKLELEKIDYNATRIFSVDETGISVVQHKTTKIIAAKGKRYVQKLSSAERGATVTVITCASAAGQYVPPMLIFPQKRWQNELLDGAPPGSIGACSESGWVNASLFAKWLEHFVDIARPTKERPIVLILDGHYSHTRNIHIIDRARETGTSIVCLPPHSTSRMQPLDVSFVFPLKTYYAVAIENWLANHPNRIVRKLQVASIFAEAHCRAATTQNAISGFSKTGIFPFKPDTFRDSDFLSHRQEVKEAIRKEQVSSDKDVSAQTRQEESSVTESYHNESSESTIISPKDIREIAVITPTNSTRRSAAFLVTGSPHEKKVVKTNEPTPSTSGGAKMTKQGTRRKLQSQETFPAEETKRRKKLKIESSSESENVPYESTDDEDTDDQDADCLLCGKPYSGDDKGEK